MIKLIKLFLISTLILATTKWTYAQEEAADCSVHETSDSIVKYIEADRKIVSNLISNLSWWNDTSTIMWKLSDDLWKTRAKFTWLSNSLFNWGWYESYFNFYVIMPIDKEIPYEVMRDHKILQNEAKMLEKTLEKLVKNSTEDSPVSDICAWVEWEWCEWIWWKTAKEVLINLIKNNINIQNLFRLVVLGEHNNFEWDLFIIDATKLLEDYNNEEITKYSKDCWTWKRFQDKMDEITNWQKVTKEWMTAWDDALLKLRCSWDTAAWVCSKKDTAKAKELEKKLLKNELSRQWLSSNMTKKMLQNLENFNTNTKSNDLVWNIIYWAKQAFKETAKSVYNWEAQKWEDWWFIKDFLTTLDWIVSNWFWKKEEVSINALNTTKNESDKTSEISKIIKELNAEWEIAAWEMASEEVKLQSRIIDIHMSLVKAIEELDDTYKNSKKVCDSQEAWWWNCNNQ